jgi:hypothetical protein
VGKIFTLSADVKAIAQQAIDDLHNELGKDCRLVYPSRMVPCANCVFDPIGKKSSNFYLNGGPAPFQNGTLCPMCDGNGLIAQEVTEVVRMLVAWSPRHWFIQKMPTNVQSPAGLIQTKGFYADVPKILQARQMILETPLEPSVRYRFFLESEPIDASNIIQGRYFVALWRRQGG